MSSNITEESARKIAINYLRQMKSTERIEVSTVEQSKETWVIRGTCPVDLEGHPWAERFDIAVDRKGKIKGSRFSLL